MLEFLVHVKFEDFDDAHPPALVIVTADVPDESIKTMSEIGVPLPSDWNAVPAPSSNAAIGDAWIESGASLGLAVPSVHPPAGTSEYNVLINPDHPDFLRIHVDVTPFAYDSRLLVARARRGTPKARRTPRGGGSH
jgi:RES domain-containing protein